MNKNFPELKLEKIFSELGKTKQKSDGRSPVHVVYGGAHLFKAETPSKLGQIALKSLETYAPNFVELAEAMWLKGADTLPQYEDLIREMENRLNWKEEKVKAENFAAWLAWTIYNRLHEKLKREPVEDFRIDFEDGYGFRTDAEEDSHAISASNELAELMRRGDDETERRSDRERGRAKDAKTDFSSWQRLGVSSSRLAFCGFRIKSFAPETYRRAIRTLDLFLANLFEKCGGKLPENFVVTLPKISRNEEIEVLAELLGDFEKSNKLEKGSIKIEIMIETPQAIFDERGENNLVNLVKAGKGRVTAAHFGAYDYTASFGISGVHQHLRHEACNFARQMMQISLAPLGVRLSDSVTIEMPIPVHKDKVLSEKQKKENKLAVHNAWRKHFNNVTNSLINGFYQSWDLHPAQLVARYAAVYAFFLESKDEQAKRLKGFIEKATQAIRTGNVFDDAASAQGLLNFFIRGLSCGAMSEAEILEITGLSRAELISGSFLKIMESHRKAEEARA